MSWFRDTFGTFVGVSSAAAASKQVDSFLAFSELTMSLTIRQAEESEPAEAFDGDKAKHVDWSGRVNYWKNLASSSISKESGFAFIEREHSASTAHVGDALKELSEIESKCKSVLSGSAGASNSVPQFCR
eukprot:767926-Hanusia_phi.AAC.5